MNSIFENILVDEIEKFKTSFSKLSKDIFTGTQKELIHPGELGMYRESVTREFLKCITPQKLKIEQGFLINSFDEVSTQCDIVIYDPQYTPLLKNKELQRFYPVETVAAVGEIKSTMSFPQFKAALIKLSKIKKISEGIKSPSIMYREIEGKFSPKVFAGDLITTFLVCQKLNFNPKRLDEVYSDTTEICHRHNLILSIEDGLFLYYDGDAITYIPTFDGITPMTPAFYNQSVDKYEYIKLFCNFIFQALCHRTLFFTQISDYMKYERK